MIVVEIYIELAIMDNNGEYKINGRTLSNEDIQQMIQIAKMYPRLSRKELVKTICVNLRWSSLVGTKKQANVENFLEKLEEDGLIKLPKNKTNRKTYSNDGGKGKNKGRKHVIPITERINPGKEVCGIINEFMPVKVELVNGVEEETLFEEYIERYHELKYGSPFGDRLKYFITIGGESPQYAGCMLFSASSWALAERDKWIGWKKEDRASKLYLVINNTRFLIFSWIKVRNLASWSLSEVSRKIRQDWWRIHRYEPVLFETFVDTEKYTGASYKAANWVYLGDTKGRGRQDRKKEYLSSSKKIYMYPLVKDFRDYLTRKKVGGDSK